MQKLPVLIGSSALCQYNLIDFKDYDIICDKNIAKELCFLADKKDKNIYFFGQNKVDIFLTENTESDCLIFTELNKFPNPKVIKLFNQFEVIVAPLEILYVIKKSHIHRILPVTSSNSSNAKIWYKQMEHYSWMRDKLGYTKMDKILYGEEKRGNPLGVDDSDNYLDKLMKTVFIKRFDETNKRVGDTKLTMDKSVSSFFEDNVERFIEHDKLHIKIAKICRNEDFELFVKFQKDKNNAMLDYDLFFNGDNKDRYQMLREEIIVLFLERKILPELIVCHKRNRKAFVGFDFDVKKSEFREIVGHFVTNLCDNGHSWLRQYCLDHFAMYSDYNSYNMDQFYKLALDISGINSDDILITYSDIKPLSDTFIRKFKELLRKSKKIDVHFTGYYCNKLSFFSNKRDKNVHEIQIIHKNFESYLSELMNGDVYYYKDGSNFIIYSFEKNIGIRVEGKEIDLFSLDVEIEDNFPDKLMIKSKTYNGGIGQDYKNKYKASHATGYYHSYDCTEQPPEERHYKYISTFGKCPGVLGDFNEILAKTYLGTDMTYAEAEADTDTIDKEDNEEPEFDDE